MNKFAISSNNNNNSLYNDSNYHRNERSHNNFNSELNRRQITVEKSNNNNRITEDNQRTVNYYDSTNSNISNEIRIVEEKPKAVDCMVMKEKLSKIIPKIFESIISKNKQDKAFYSSIFDFTTTIKISFQDYLIRLIKYTQVESNTLIVCLALIDSLCSTKRIFLSYNNVHKIFFTALLISIKLNEDEIYVEKHYSLCSGISANEIAELEREFLRLIEYNIHINQERYLVYLKAFC